MSDAIIDLIIVILMVNLLFAVNRTTPKRQRDEVDIDWSRVGPYAAIVAMGAVSILLWHATMDAIGQQIAATPSLSQGSNAWFIAAVPWVLGAALFMFPVLLVLRVIEERRQR